MSDDGNRTNNTHFENFKEGLVSVKEAAFLSNYTTAHISRLLRQGKLKGVKIGHKRYVDTSSLNNFLIAIKREKRLKAKQLSENLLAERNKEKTFQEEIITYTKIEVSSDLQRQVSSPVNTLATMLEAAIITTCLSLVLAVGFVGGSEKLNVTKLNSGVEEVAGTVVKSLVFVDSFETVSVDAPEKLPAAAYTALGRYVDQVWCGVNLFVDSTFECYEGNENTAVPEERTVVTVATSTTNQYITNPVEKETIREVVVRENVIDTSQFVTWTSYQNQIDAVMRSIEDGDSGNNGGGSTDLTNINNTSLTTVTLTVSGDASVAGTLADSSGTVGTAGYVLQTTATGTQWVATSSLGFVTGSGLISLNGQTGNSQTFATSSSGGLSFNVTSSGDIHTFTAGLSSGYIIPLTASTTEWTTAYGWGDHSAAGYLTTVSSSSLSAANWTNGYILQASTTAASGFDWVATSTLGLSTPWTTSGSNIYYSTGNVGIGNSVTSPDALLELANDWNTDDTKLIFNSDSKNFGESDFVDFQVGGSLWNRIGSEVTSGSAGALTFYTKDSGGTTEKMRIDTNGNVGIGTTTPNKKLTVHGNINISDSSVGYMINGSQVLYASSTGSTRLTFAGINAGSSNSGTYVTAVGYGAGASNTGSTITALGESAAEFNSGSDVTAIGYSAAASNSGTLVTALGESALTNNSGDSVVGIGYNTLAANVSDYIVGVGDEALYYRNATASVAIGYRAGYGGDTTRRNIASSTFLGYRAGAGIMTGSNNLLLGYQAGDSLTTGSNNIAIGYDIELPSNTGSNQLSIGNLIFGTGIDGTGTTLSSGNVGIGTTSPDEKLSVYGGITQSATDPTWVSEIDSADLNGAFSVYVSGEYAYLANFNDDSFRIVDISDPESMTIVGGIKNASRLNGPRSVVVSGDYAYVASNVDDSFQVIDISDKTTPTLVAEVTGTSLNGIFDIVISGQYAYVANTVDTSIRIIDISDPTNPTIVGGVKDATNLNYATSLAVTGRYAYVASSLGDSFTIVDVSSTTNPVVVSTLIDATNLNGANTVVVNGRYAYVSANSNNSVEVIDISSSTNPTIVGGLQDGVYLSGVQGITLAGRYLYTASGNGNRMSILDLSSTTNPVVAASIQDAANLSGISSVAISGRYAFTANFNDDSIAAINLHGTNLATAEIGGLEAGILKVSSEASIRNNLFVGNALNVGYNAAIGGALTITGSASSTALANENYNSFVVKTGRVGIGTNSPSSKLTVQGTAGTSTIFTIASSTGSSLVTVSSAGFVTPGTDNAQELGSASLHWDCIYYDATTLGTCSSDERLKLNIQDFTFNESTDKSPLQQLVDLQPRTFEWIENPGVTNYGFIAQEVQEAAPDLVEVGKDGYLQVRYGYFTYLIIEAVQELYDQFLTLKNTVASLAENITTKEVIVEDRICIDNTCIDEDSLRALLRNSDVNIIHRSDNDQSDNETSATSTATTTDNGTNTGTTTTPVATSTEPVASSTDPVATTTDNGTDVSTTTEEVVTDTTAPEITGTDSTTITEGDTFNSMEGVSATDDTDGDVTSNITVSGTVDTSTPGTYTLTYTVADSSNNETTTDRTITVEALPDPESETEEVASSTEGSV